ncbi:MAG: ABC transporter ATP-binding protein [Thermodesulfobacteriota bacterium]
MYSPDLHEEEGYTLRAPEWQLLGRLWPYLKPSLAAMLLALGLMLAFTGLEVLIPQVTRVAIDRHLGRVDREWRADRPVPPELAGVVEALRPALVPLPVPGRFLLPAAALTAVGAPERQRLEAAGLIEPRRLLAVSLETAEAQDLARRYPQTLWPIPQGLAGELDRLADLPAADRLRLRQDDLRGLALLAAALTGLLLLAFGASFGQSYVLEAVSQKTMHRLRLALFAHLAGQGIAFFDRQPLGRLVTRVTNDIQNLDQLFTAVFVALFKDLLLVAGILILLAAKDPLLAGACLASLPFFALFGVFFKRRNLAIFRVVRAKIGIMNGLLQESLTAMRVVQLFRQEAALLDRFSTVNREHAAASQSQIAVNAIFLPLVDWVTYLVIALVLWRGGLGVLADQLSLGTMVAFMAYIRMFYRPVREIAEKVNLLQSGAASLERVFALFDERTALPGAAGHEPVPGRGGLRFAGVGFGYDPARPVLDDLSFAVAPGERVALVGPTGAGKTTVAHLLARFYDVQKGAILLDGSDLRQLPEAALRRRLGLVLQEVFLFAGTVRENICLGRQVPEAELGQVLAAVHADRFVAALPQGVDTVLQHGGSDLSAGQRQLLAFARLILHDPQVVLLDEATANIDPETEALVQAAMERILRGRTALVIAHRLATVRQVDRILVLDRGRLVQEGRHDELKARPGLYQQLALLQEGLAASLGGQP